jgi:hypothetical protein
MQTALDDHAIIARARKNLQRALTSAETGSAPQSDSRWLAYSQWASQEIPLLSTVKEVVAFAQLRFGFESRPTGSRHRKYFKQIRNKLRQEFPDADDRINAFTESPFSAQKVCLTADGRSVSYQLLNLVRFHLTAIAYTPPANTVCEIGGNTCVSGSRTAPNLRQWSMKLSLRINHRSPLAESVVKNFTCQGL